MLPVLKVCGLKKTYRAGKKNALSGIDLEIKPKQVFGILGPNGAGKSTFIKIAAGLMDYDEGELLVLGRNPSEALSDIGYVPEDGVLYHYLSGLDFLKLIGGLRGLSSKKTLEMIEKYKEILMLPNLNDLISTYSKGNREKILFLTSLLHEPKLLLLDEPFTGLDPMVIRNVKKLIRRYADDGNTVILSTHILELASQLCDEVAVIDGGVIRGRHIMLSEDHLLRFETIEALYVSSTRKRSEI